MCFQRRRAACDDPFCRREYVHLESVPIHLFGKLSPCQLSHSIKVFRSQFAINAIGTTGFRGVTDTQQVNPPAGKGVFKDAEKPIPVTFAVTADDRSKKTAEDALDLPPGWHMSFRVTRAQTRCLGKTITLRSAVP